MGRPSLPADLTELGDENLIDLMVKLTRWADFAGSQLALAEIDHRASERLLDRAGDIALLRGMPTADALRKREDTMTRVKAEVNTDDAIIELQQEEMTRYAKRKLLAAEYESMQRDAAVVSRELTRRTEREPTSRRSNRARA